MFLQKKSIMQALSANMFMDFYCENCRREFSAMTRKRKLTVWVGCLENEENEENGESEENGEKRKKRKTRKFQFYGSLILLL